MTSAPTTPGSHDFDFLFGSWSIVNDRLTERLRGADEWERFPARGTCRPVLGGLGNVDDFRPAWPARPGYEGMALRLFDAATGLWSISWADTTNGCLGPPVVGRFTDGVGEFFGDDEHAGTPVKVRFRWSGITAVAARWEQAFSADGGETWELNWVMSFTRDRAAASAPPAPPAEGRDRRPASVTHLGNVPAAYQHEWRVATPQAPLALPRAIFKWYHVHRDGHTVPRALAAEARAVIADDQAGGAWDPSYGLNFALLHVSTSHAFLIAGVWRGHQELWERIYQKPLGSDEPFRRMPTDGEDAPVGCVWELAVTCHERMAWHRYLSSARADEDKRAWLADQYAGPA
jgi:hypothetical protein